MGIAAQVVTSLTLTTSHQQFAAAADPTAVHSIEIDAATLAAGEIVEVVIEEKVASGDGSATQLGDPIYISGPSPPVRQLMVADFRFALRITAKQFSGTMRTIRLVQKPIS